MSRYPVASVHGRFQPFHLGHLEYVLAAKEQCDFLWVGITQPNIRALQTMEFGERRALGQNNPLTYFERITTISSVLKEHGVTPTEFAFVPFPIENPQLLPDYLGIDIPCFTTVYDDWNRKKIEVLRGLGYHVIVLWERHVKEVEGESIRNRILVGDDAWMQLVPPATVQAVSQLNMKDRLVRLCP